MGVVKRFKGHDDFEESCFKLGIPWVPPQVFGLSLKYKQIWQRKVLIGKIKVKRPKDIQFIKRYKKALKEATIVNGKLDIDSLPVEFHSYYYELRKRKEFYSRYRKQIKDRDLKLYLHKWYPWSYKKDIPVVVLQGFYSKKAANRRFITYYGKKATSTVHWIKGRGAVERDFTIGQTLLINNKWVKPISKVLLTENYNKKAGIAKEILGKELAKKNIKKSQKKEKYLLELVDKFNYGTKEFRTVRTHISEKQVNLSEAKKAEFQRKKSIYEPE